MITNDSAPPADLSAASQSHLANAAEAIMRLQVAGDIPALTTKQVLEVARAVLSATNPAPENHVVVTPLVWSRWPDEDGTAQFEGVEPKRKYVARAMTPFGAIFLMSRNGIEFTLVASGSQRTDEGTFSCADDAKAAAQSDYERRILSAIADPASSTNTASSYEPWGEVRKGSDGKLAIFSTKFNTVKARFDPGNDSGWGLHEVLYRARPAPQPNVELTEEKKSHSVHMNVSEGMVRKGGINPYPSNVISRPSLPGPSQAPQPNVRELTEAQQQAQAALDKVMNCRFSNFDAGAVVHWAERGLYQVKTDPASVSNVVLAPKHTGLRVDYTGLLKSARQGLKREPGTAEMLNQLEEHLSELGRRWYDGDATVVDEFLQLYCIQRVRRDVLAAGTTEGSADGR